ncbi:hypothetical protein [Candidatus Coxiella mudrowiae]|uniref:hypothetical protein n=1 Tax=Candidatus Coxiella mudrowiae TaxID=2054173 RepID=UPI000662C079|nr:hypothetical protein [Candidatus Coxiella mudrowiae]
MAVTLSDTKAMVDLARMYEGGDLQQLVSYLQNYEAARSLLNQAASLNEPLVRTELALIELNWYEAEEWSEMVVKPENY